MRKEKVGKRWKGRKCDGKEAGKVNERKRGNGRN